MATEFEGTMRFPAKPEKIFEMITDPLYVQWKHSHMGGTDIKVDVKSEGKDIVVSSSRRLPAKIPAAARSIVGETIQIDEVHRWGPKKADGSRVAEVSATFGNAPMFINGSMHLEPEASGSVVKARIVAKASVPLIGGKLEGVAGEQFLRALNKEEGISPEWLAEGHTEA
ncbi:MAG: DUF2505 domain-containing protein [Propionicimonas sp.]